MKKILIVLALCLLAGGKVQAQRDMMVLPDSLGKYMYELFINHAPLEQADIKISNPSKGLHPTFCWEVLQRSIFAKEVNVDNTEYYNTDFSFSQDEQYEQLEIGEYIIFVALKYGSEVYAFKFRAIFNAGFWEITLVEPKIYTWDGTNFNTFEEFAEGYDDRIVAWNESFIPTINLKDSPKIASPVAFADMLYDIIKEKAPENIESLFFTEKQYDELISPKIRAKLDVVFATKRLSEEHLLLAKKKYASPFSDYNDAMQLFDKKLSKFAKVLFQTDNIETLECRHKYVNVSNRDSKGLLEIMIIMELNDDGIDGQMTFSGTMSDGVWKINLTEFPTFQVN